MGRESGHRTTRKHSSQSDRRAARRVKRFAFHWKTRKLWSQSDQRAARAEKRFAFHWTMRKLWSQSDQRAARLGIPGPRAVSAAIAPLTRVGADLRHRVCRRRGAFVCGSAGGGVARARGRRLCLAAGSSLVGRRSVARCVLGSAFARAATRDGACSALGGGCRRRACGDRRLGGRGRIRLPGRPARRHRCRPWRCAAAATCSAVR